MCCVLASHLAKGNMASHCSSMFSMCVGDEKHSSLSIVNPTSIMSISHSSLSYKGGEGGIFILLGGAGQAQWVIEVEDKLKSLFSLNCWAAKYVTVEPTKVQVEKTICQNYSTEINHPHICSSVSHTKPTSTED